MPPAVAAEFLLHFLYRIKLQQLYPLSYTQLIIEISSSCDGEAMSRSGFVSCACADANHMQVYDPDEENKEVPQKSLDIEGAGRSYMSPGWLTQLGRLWGGKSVSSQPQKPQ